ncbi:centrosomal protein of 120 kDa [Nasonia vitripennis]|uniref:DUF3668 domain-containing protein n=1 Tax=Nasonia vitripennis TaxID=7425 RepID=A0A7M7LUE8_NASVI|nr:centrosomal protein of 120 kDa [Nasonia vitripennis]
MEDFTSPNLQLILGVKEGSHFDRVLKPTIIIATLNGHCLETKKIQPDCNPQYATDLIWDTDKNALRKMRCNQTPIKVECYAVNDNGSREKLGYILLSVRCAQIIHRDKESNIKTNWHNILGVRNDFNNCKPQLLLYLIIKEKTNNLMSKEDALPKSIYSDIAPVWLEDECLIQLGPLETCHDMFLLNIITEAATNLNYLNQEFKENGNNDFAFSYNVFDTIIKLKPFRPEFDKILINEKITIKIRTSMTVLMNYLYTKPHFFVKLKHKSFMIGQSEVDLRFLITTSSLQEFRQLNKNATSALDHYCVFKNLHSKECKGDYRRGGEEIDKLPSLKIHVQLQSIESKGVTSEGNISNYHYSPRPQVAQNNPVSLLKQHNYFEGQKSHSNFHNRVPSVSSLEKMIHFPERSAHHKNTSIMNNGLHHSMENVSKPTSNHNSYCLNVHLDSIKFFDSKSDVKNIEFRFYHPHGEIITTISKSVSVTAEQTIQLKDVKCKLHFISPSDEIEQLLTTFAPKINISDTTFSERKCIAQISLDVKRLFVGEKPECHYVDSLVDCHMRKEIGNAEITMVLEDYNLSALNRIQKGTPETVLDNSLAYKIVDELETWKERQKEMFKDELRKKEEMHLRLLNEEWQRRRACLESQLATNVEQCKVLASNLSKATEDLRTRKIQSLEKETKLIQANEELQWKYDRKLHQLQNALQKMQEEFSSKLMSLEEQNRSLLSQIELLNEKNYELEKIRRDQNEKIEAHKKASLTEDQTTSVLQQLKNLEEKLDKAQRSKAFFKEQWSKAVKEIHMLKMENQQAVECQIRNSKTELDNLDLEEILHADSTALTYDQMALNQIQREIDIMHPESGLQYFKSNTSDRILNSLTDICSNNDRNYPRSDISTNSSSSDGKLNMLIEKRDSLLKNGNFTSEDGVIIKLNAEIRSILMKS